MSLKHPDLMALCNRFGEDGVCHGFSVTVGQALLCGKLHVFVDRLALIETYIKEYNAMYLNYWVTQEKVLAKLETDLSKVSHKDTKTLNEKERKLLELHTFLMDLKIAQDPDKYRGLFDNQCMTQAKLEQVFPILHSIQDVSRRPVSIIAKNNYVCDQDELLIYLNHLEQCLKKQDTAIPIFLSNGIHRVVISYDQKSQNWLFFDSNQLVDNTFYQKTNSRDLAAILFRTLFLNSEGNGYDDDYILLNVTAVSNSNNKEQEKAYFQSPHLKSAAMRVNYSNEKKQGLLHIACLENDLMGVTELLKMDDTDVNKADKNGDCPLSMACQYGYWDIVEQLLKHKDIKVNKELVDFFGTRLLQIAWDNRLSTVVKQIRKHDHKKALVSQNRLAMFQMHQSMNSLAMEPFIRHSII